MTANPPPDRLDRIEDDLETVKNILLTVARCQESLSEARQNLEPPRTTGFRVDQVTEQMGRLAIQMEGMLKQTEQDRSQAAIDRADFRSPFQQRNRITFTRQGFKGLRLQKIESVSSGLSSLI